MKRGQVSSYVRIGRILQRNDTTDTHEAGISPLLCSGRERLQEPCIQGDIEN